MGRFRRRNGCRADKQGPTGLSAIARRATAGVESNALEFLVRGRVAKSMMADGPQSARQDMAQVAGDKLRTGDGFHTRGVALGAVLVAEGDMGVGDTGISRCPALWRNPGRKLDKPNTARYETVNRQKRQS